MKKILSSAFASALIVSLLAGCTVPAAQSEKETQPLINWAEDEGVEATDEREFDLTGFPYYMTDDRLGHSEEIFPVSADMHYKFISAEASEPDKYGQVTYTVKYDYDITIVCKDDDTVLASDKGYTKSNAQVLFFGVVDSSTGIISNRTELRSNAGSLTLTEITNGDSRYTIAWKMMFENFWDEWEYFEEDGIDYSSIVIHRPITMTIAAPEGYDGVYLYLTKLNDTEYDTTRYDSIESHEWGDLEGDISDYYFVKLTDLL